MFHLSLFQWLALAVLSAVALRDILTLATAHARRRLPLLRLLVILVAAWLIARPSQTTVWANVLGIGRGTDLILYVYILVSMAAVFLLYARCIRLERQVTAIVRWEALHAAECGVPGSRNEPLPRTGETPSSSPSSGGEDQGSDARGG